MLDGDAGSPGLSPAKQMGGMLEPLFNFSLTESEVSSLSKLAAQ
jgi:hypothetical protein